MRRTKRSGGFIICLLFNMLINLEWSIPAWVLLALHFWLDISIWWFVGALAFWILSIISWMGIMGWANRNSTPDPPRENKNPYSVRSSDQIVRKDEN